MKRIVGRRIGHALLICAALFSSWGWPTAPIAHAESNCDPDGEQASGAVYRICMPAEGEWNGDLVVFAHGYVAYNEPVAIPEDQLILPGGISIPEMVNGLGYAFATTSYSVNGLAVRQGLDDLVDLVDIFCDTHGGHDDDDDHGHHHGHRCHHDQEDDHGNNGEDDDHGNPHRWPDHVYLVGPSEGGLITALALEGHADVFDGGLSSCGPVGSFSWQISYWGDVRVLFDYFFPHVIPGSPIDIPQGVIDHWDTIYGPRVEAALRAHPAKLAQLLEVAEIPAHPFNTEKNIEAVLGLLWYNVFATNDGVAKLGGQPFDNSLHYYRDSTNDVRLNQLIARFQADQAAVDEMSNHYQTSGDLGGPLVTLHTLGDPIVPYWHEPFYDLKIEAQNKEALHTNIFIASRYGHCNFSAPQVLVAFALLVREVTGDPLLNAERVLPTAEERAEYQDLLAAYGGTGTLPLQTSVYLPIVMR